MCVCASLALIVNTVEVSNTTHMLVKMCNRLTPKLITDIDECQLSMHLCSQYCINTEGSYECYCGSGYALDAADNSTCLGKENRFDVSYTE